MSCVLYVRVLRADAEKFRYFTGREAGKFEFFKTNLLRCLFAQMQL
jgi:hypothetical protein